MIFLVGALSILTIASQITSFPQYSFPYDRSSNFRPGFQPAIQGNYPFVSPNGLKGLYYPPNSLNSLKPITQEELANFQPKKEEKKKKENQTTPDSKDKDEGKDEQKEDKKESDPNENIRYVPIPVYPPYPPPPVLTSRTSPYPAPYQPYGNYPYPSPYGYSPFG